MTALSGPRPAVSAEVGPAALGRCGVSYPHHDTDSSVVEQRHHAGVPDAAHDADGITMVGGNLDESKLGQPALPRAYVGNASVPARTEVATQRPRTFRLPRTFVDANFDAHDRDDMPSRPETEAKAKANIAISQRRKRLEAPHRPGEYMSRAELADAVNKALRELYPDNSDRGGLAVTARWIGYVERGEHRWPSEKRRAALRHVFGVDDDGQLGLYNPRRTGELVDDTGESPVSGTTGAVPRPQPPTDCDGTVRTAKCLAEVLDSAAPVRLDTSRAYPARRYNYWLGGKDHFAADRASGDAIAAAFPAVRAAAGANRAFMRRSVRFLAEEAGVRQFLDIGPGLPARDNTHEIAQRADPTARVLYVDNDPLVMTHARALMLGNPRGRIGHLEADLRNPSNILHSSALPATLDLQQPVGLLLIAVLHFLRNDAEAENAVRQLMQALPSGSYLAISHLTLDFSPSADVEAYARMYADGSIDARARPKDTIASYLRGLHLVEPGITAITKWRPGPTIERSLPAAEAPLYGAIGRVP